MSGMTVPVESQVKYLNRRSEELAQIEASLVTIPDWDLIKKVGHQMKGNASTFGFSQLTDFGMHLESAATDGDILLVGDISRKLKEEVQRLLQALSSFS